MLPVPGTPALALIVVIFPTSRCCEDTILRFGCGVQRMARTEGGTERNGGLRGRGFVALGYEKCFRRSSWTREIAVATATLSIFVQSACSAWFRNWR